VTAHADVVLPVAAAPEKAGSYLDWEGRVRPFDATLHGTGQLTDGRVLHGIAEHLGVPLGLSTVTDARAELIALGAAPQAPAPTGLDVAPVEVPVPTGEQAVLASWRQLLDVGTLQREEPALAGTARRPLARLGKDAAARLGLADGDLLTVTGPGGAVTLPAAVVDMPDGVVWLPTRSPGCDVRTDLHAGPGDVVRLSAAPPPAGATAVSSLRAGGAA
jgi:NADH-quinone oxidoreductase subunit G